MKSPSLRIGLLLLGASVATACGGEAGDGAVGDNTTAQLLAEPAGDGMSTPIVGAPATVPEGERIQVTELGFNRGDPEAIVKVVEMSDFGCGYCRKFHDETFPSIREQFVESGMVEWKFLPYITGMFENSLVVTEAGECVMEQSLEAYESIAQRLWVDQSTWKGSSQPEPLIRGWVDELDVDMDDFDSCLAEDRRVARIASATTLSRQLGVRGTPTFIIIGYPPLQGALPLSFFQDILTAVHSQETRRLEEAGGQEPGGQDDARNQEPGGPQDDARN
jgi:protein-disulfide isomerase